MSNRCDFCHGACASRAAHGLWVDLTRAGTALLAAPQGESSCIRRVQAPTQIAGAIEAHAPHFLCFEFDDPDAPGIDALALTRRQLPHLPVLMITGSLSKAVALWALRARVWDLLVKPVDAVDLRQHVATLCTLTQNPTQDPTATRAMTFISAPVPAPDKPLAPPCAGALPALDAPPSPVRTHLATEHVAAQFFGRISLDQAAALCRLSTSQFCRVFRQEHGVSFGQYLLRYRIERACECLGHRDVLAKEVAYAVG